MHVAEHGTMLDMVNDIESEASQYCQYVAQSSPLVHTPATKHTARIDCGHTHQGAATQDNQASIAEFPRWLTSSVYADLAS